MANNSVELLVDKWLNEPGFREKMKHDLEGTVRGCGVKLSPEEWATVRNVVMTTSDEALRARASKAGGGWDAN